MMTGQECFFEFIPQILFMMCTFGYMIFLIIFKYCQDYSVNGQNPPNLIQTMIGMFLTPGHIENPLYNKSTQAGVQTALVLIALLSVPVMLFGKPCWIRAKSKGHKDEHREGPVIEEEKGGESKHEEADDGEHAEHSFGDLMIHQSIHTIEFVLGTVSNTASYLRLWALSLAHSELADVFWTKLIDAYGLDLNNPFFVFVAFAVWAAVTVGVLLLMDVLECFLHALRLHWVEFQNKFYRADGYIFKPFNFDGEEEK